MSNRMLLVLFGSVTIASASQAQTTTYLLRIQSGLAHTDGGISGSGVGDLTMQGMFRLHVDPATNDAALENVDISFVGHPTLPLAFNWSSLAGTIDGTSLSLSSSSPGFGDSLLTGTFDGSSADLAGIFYDACPDCYQYEPSFSASVVPEPVSLLYAAAAVGILGVRRRHRSVCVGRSANHRQGGQSSV